MSPRAFVLAEALQLPRSERAAIAQELLASLDGPAEEDVEASWLAEVERRLGDVEGGVSEPSPWEDVHERIVARLKALRG